jgi:UMF1 family MFS transporter
MDAGAAHFNAPIQPEAGFMAAATLGSLPIQQRKVIRAWCVYDWANSAYATSGIAAIFPVYFVLLFREALGESTTFLGLTFTGSSVWSFGIAVSTGLVALSSPLLGVIADRVPIKKALLWVYTMVGALFTVLMFVSAYTAHPWAWMLGMLALANIGFAGCLVFYNSFLPHIAPRELLDDVSSRGFAYGYVGGGLLLLVHLGLILMTRNTGLADVVTRACIASVGVWWFGWALWTLKVVPEPPLHRVVGGLSPLRAISLGFAELARTFREIRLFKVLLTYILAYLLFNDGIQTVLVIAGAFAADTIGIPLAFNMATILTIQFVAAGGAMAFARLAERISTKAALTVALLVWIIIIMFGVAVVPLTPAEHDDFDYQLSFHSVSSNYTLTRAPALGESRSEVLWREEVGNMTIGAALDSGRAERLLDSVRRSESSLYGISISGGGLDGQTAVGRLHPSTLGEGPVDWWPAAVRQWVWRPLGLDAPYQWLALGVALGVVLGGSQALARSLFAKISPVSRSGEFFSFFGFMSRASSVFGPIIYVVVTGLLDTRVAVLAIMLLIVAGVIVLRWVDVAAGTRMADAEAARFPATGE